MCVAELNLSLQPCAHRWYQLVRPCDPANNLANCPEKLKLAGWEKRPEHCPFCDLGTKHHHTTHRLFGSTSSASSVASSPTMSDDPMSPSTRRDSQGTLNGTIMSPLSRQTSGSSMECPRSQRARDMNERILQYLYSDPHEVLPSARKNYPTYAAAIARAQNEPSRPPNYRLHHQESFSRGWKRVSKKFGADLFKIA